MVVVVVRWRWRVSTFIEIALITLRWGRRGILM
jgi:hypothetical protein